MVKNQLKYQYEKGKSLLQEYIRGNISTSDAFDTKSLAKFLAISDITGSNHALYFHNLRFYHLFFFCKVKFFFLNR